MWVKTNWNYKNVSFSLTSTIFSICLLMITGLALGFTDAAHSSKIDSFLGAGLEEVVEFWFRKQKNKCLQVCIYLHI